MEVEGDQDNQVFWFERSPDHPITRSPDHALSASERVAQSPDVLITRYEDDHANQAAGS
jgi:hypothetical protein